GLPGEIYNLGAGQELPNLEVVDSILRAVQGDRALIRHVPDREGHDRRYALNIEKATALGWEPRVAFKEGIERTAVWYRENPEWWSPLKDERYQRYYQRQYAERLQQSGR
ncbi:MAG: dTDP-glucose 4,6-dehydratase, partial [Chloroflexota bacterium]